VSLPGLPVLLLATALAGAPAESTPAEEGPADERSWSVTGQLYHTLVPDDADYLQPTILFDGGWMHLEARYNYEDQRTVSLWMGYNLSVGSEVTLDLTPMIGGVFGDTGGIAIGARAALSWWRLELASESEFVIDARHASDNFLYTWSELTIAPLDWLRFGLSTQRTRAYETDVDLHRGLVVGLTWRWLDVSGYAFDLDGDEPVFMLGLCFTY